MAKIIDGKKIADGVAERIRKKIEENKLKLRLAVILIGNDPVSLSYISQKEKTSKKVGIGFSLYQLPKKTSKKEIIKKIKEVSRSCSGLIVQLPLPLENSEQEILNSIPEEKDIDFLSETNLGKFYSGNFSILPPVVGAINCILKEKRISVKEKNIVLIGFGRLVGKPLSFWLASQEATVSIINKSTKNPSFFTKKADILISGTGQSRLIKGSMVKKGVIAIDAGSSFLKGKIVGDLDKSVFKKSLIYSSVPGGVGPITTACLIENLIKMNGY